MTSASAAEAILRDAIGRIATGPEYSRDLEAPAARDAMDAVLGDVADPVQAAVFLVALRMKRETDAENLGLLAALQGHSEHVVCDVDELVDVADPYDGYGKGLPAGPFLPAVLAACGLPAMCHGAWSVGPKHGLTTAQVLRECGRPTEMSPIAAAAAVAKGGCGWAYVDQAQASPALHRLLGLRDQIVKRTALSTIEKLLRPLRGRRATHLLTGYVHVAYPRIYALLARAAGYDSALVVRGMEGGVLPSLRQPGKAIRYTPDMATAECAVTPDSADVRQSVRMPPLPPGSGHATAPDAAEAGQRALAGQPGAMHDALVYGAALCLWHTGHAPSCEAAAARAREALASGAARAHFQAFNEH